MLTVFVFSVLFFGMFLVAHMFTFHFFDPKRKFRSMLLTILFIGSAYSVFLLILPEKVFFPRDRSILDGIVEWALIIYFYFFLWYFYFHSLIVVDRSISIRMLVEIFTSRGGRLSLEEMKKRYSLEEKFSDEVKDMLFLDRFRVDRGLYSNTWKASMQARIFMFLRGYMNLSKNTEKPGEGRGQGAK